MTTGRSLDVFTRRWFIGGLAGLGAAAGRGLFAAPGVASQSGAQAKAVLVKDEKKGDLVEITFPAAQTRAKCRVFEYEVTAVLVEDDVDLVQLQRRVMAPDFHLPETKDGVAGRCVIAMADLPMKGHYRFDVRPIECFGLKGRAIHTAII